MSAPFHDRTGKPQENNIDGFQWETDFGNDIGAGLW